MTCINLRNEVIKVLGIYFSCNQKIKDEKKIIILFKIFKVSVLTLWRMRDLTLEGGLVIFRTLSISKTVFLALLIKITYQLVKELEKIQKSFLWKNTTPKIKYETTCTD